MCIYSVIMHRFFGGKNILSKVFTSPFSRTHYNEAHIWKENVRKKMLKRYSGSGMAFITISFFVSEDSLTSENFFLMRTEQFSYC